MESAWAKRTLAAVVFTDVAGFSRIAALDEQKALSLVNRDFNLMRAACATNEGRVVNEMGDGLLMLFTSAVNAMACALEIQEKLREQGSGLKESDVLLHRIGVHVGDVMIDGSNVFGDGVNVASRLQSQAKPGTVCFSRAVYDVVRNKLEVNAIYMGPRALKNIPEPVGIWQTVIPGQPIDIPSPSYEDLERPATTPTVAREALLIGGSLALVAVLAVGFVVFSRQKWNPPAAPALPPRLGQVRHKAPVVAEPSAPPSTPLAEPPVSPMEDDKANLDALRSRYDFAGVVAYLNEHPRAGGSGEAAKYRRLADMRQWLDGTVGQATQDAPIRLGVDPDGAAAQVAVFTSSGSLLVDAGATPVARPLATWKPEALLGLAETCAAMPGAPPDASSWMELFAAEFGVGQGGR